MGDLDCQQGDCSHIQTATVEEREFVKLPLHIVLDPEVGLGEKMTWVAIAYFQWKSKSRRGVFVSDRQMASLLCIGRATVGRYVSQLVDRGHLEVVSHGRKGTHYTLKSKMFGGVGYVYEVTEDPYTQPGIKVQNDVIEHGSLRPEEIKYHTKEVLKKLAEKDGMGVDDWIWMWLEENKLLDDSTGYGKRKNKKPMNDDGVRKKVKGSSGKW